MFIFHRAPGRLGLALLLGAALSACSFLQPYRVPVVQGNVVTREQVGVLRPGMSRIQVRDILGTPLLASVFHADRWDYVFTLKRQGAEPQARRVTVYFKGEVLDRFEADPLPSETEFAATLGGREKPKVPVLEAAPEKLQEFPAPAPAPEAKPLPPLPASYPPLEPAAR
ncbi:outer membrane protein assembly factor BamE [Rhodoferax sp. BAB1]|uniref:outer membrane protein assembly factor BamE n=1 Tax=Rhodoferax sp. BAB1 TaxID=2741720 RepID=UPI001575BB3E|nr:outer membrane protein assembly factor BamE [Rhodoferax sp. BAB1]QKO23576.1 outer membrane protein assembly factor BamE [Rhodoferax sp. BAB1]